MSSETFTSSQKVDNRILTTGLSKCKFILRSAMTLLTDIVSDLVVFVESRSPPSGMTPVAY